MDLQITFSIGDAARASGLTVKTIRYYEEIGLVPKPARKEGGPHGSGHRIYNQEEVARMRFIRHARLFGLPLADIRELLALADGTGCPSREPEYQEILTRRLRQIDERIQHLLGLRTAIRSSVARRALRTAEVLTGDLHVHGKDYTGKATAGCRLVGSQRRTPCVNSAAAAARTRQSACRPLCLREENRLTCVSSRSQQSRRVRAALPSTTTPTREQRKAAGEGYGRSLNQSRRRNHARLGLHAWDRYRA